MNINVSSFTTLYLDNAIFYETGTSANLGARVAIHQNSKPKDQIQAR
jgi:hypothetical protein